MVEVEIIPSALQDIKNILDYVYKVSVQNAGKLYKELIEKIASLKQFSERRSLVKEIANIQLRELKLYRFRIIYKCTESKVQVLTVHHSTRPLIHNPQLKDLM